LVNLFFVSDVYDLTKKESKKSPAELYEEVIKKPVSDFYKMEWTDFLEKYDKYTLKDYLKEEGRLSNGAIEIIGETRWQKQLAEKIAENKTKQYYFQEYFLTLRLS
jgi:hypothetical protein